ncbi:hypothetical protein HGB07_09575, partial [Candidatus Roizmanbacteria bacterium]|nr:hypothetical protein [Candidatus Roizmanbacteria bacterium]
MDYDKIIQISLELYPEDEKAFLANVVKTSLDEEKVLTLLQNFVDIKKQIQLILASPKPKSKLLQQFRAPIISSPFVKALKSEFRQQQRILGCPKIDEHVLLLSALKLLEAKDILLYKPVLKDILQRNIHKLRDLSTDTSFVERTKAINDIVKTLSRSSRNNIVIVGKAGVGKTTLAKSMYRYLPQYSMYQLFAGGDAFIDQVINLISIQNTNKVVFMLDEIFSFESSQIKYLIEHAQVIGTAHESAYKKFATEYPHIASKLEIIMLEEPNQEELQRIINAHKDRIQQQTGVILENDVTEEMFQLARQYMGDKFFPAKGILLFEEAANAAKYGGRKITKDIIRALISQITNIPISSLSELDKKDLSNLGDKLRIKVKG